ncbi:MAG TPA: acyltransferase [Gammaproteobacteria bacterium]|nr:acyltransferase [Gammaproteobacteria bacterium]
MERHTSLYLDVMRFSAAAAVFCAHFSSQRYSAGLFWQMEHYGGQAVMIFFVLSGFVISYTADTRDDTLRVFMRNRLARMYSVVVPALILTVAADSIGLALAPDLYSPTWGFQNNMPFVQSLLTLTFLTQAWGMHVQPFSMGPFWSLSYEFWYYILFATLMFLRGRKQFVVLGLAILIVGAPILLLLPVWWLGVMTYRFTKRHRVSEPVGYILFIGSFVAFAALQVMPGRDGLDPWFHDHIWPYVNREFFPPINLIFDWMLGLLVAANILGFNAIGHRVIVPLQRVKRPIRYIAGLTFSLYLYHMPLLQLGAAVYGDHPNSWGQKVFLLSTVPIIIWLIGSVTEHKKEVARNMILFVENAAQSGYAKVSGRLGQA